MIVIGIIFIIASVIAFCYSINLDDVLSIILFILSLVAMCFAIGFITDGIKNLKSEEKEIKNVEYYKIKSTVIIEDNIPIDTIYTIYYKKK